jgi:DNA-binding NarL/FixJ family response regulator
MPLRILLIEPEELVRESLAALFSTRADFQIVAQSGDGYDALRLATAHSPDVVLLEIALPGLRGIPLLRKLVAQVPSAKVLVLTSADAPFNVHLALEAGASGYLFKTASASDFFAALSSVHRGGRPLSPGVLALLEKLFAAPSGPRASRVSSRNHLSRREIDVLCMIANSYDNEQIAEDLAISVKTVQKHRQRTMDKLNLHNVAGLTRFALSAGWLNLSHAAPTARPVA